MQLDEAINDSQISQQKQNWLKGTIHSLNDEDASKLLKRGSSGMGVVFALVGQYSAHHLGFDLNTMNTASGVAAMTFYYSHLFLSGGAQFLKKFTGEDKLLPSGTDKAKGSGLMQGAKKIVNNYYSRNGQQTEQTGLKGLASSITKWHRKDTAVKRFLDSFAISMAAIGLAEMRAGLDIDGGLSSFVDEGIDEGIETLFKSSELESNFEGGVQPESPQFESNLEGASQPSATEQAIESQTETSTPDLAEATPEPTSSGSSLQSFMLAIYDWYSSQSNSQEKNFWEGWSSTTPTSTPEVSTQDVSPYSLPTDSEPYYPDGTDAPPPEPTAPNRVAHLSSQEFDSFNDLLDEASKNEERLDDFVSALLTALDENGSIESANGTEFKTGLPNKEIAVDALIEEINASSFSDLTDEQKYELLEKLNEIAGKFDDISILSTVSNAGDAASDFSVALFDEDDATGRPGLVSRILNALDIDPAQDSEVSASKQDTSEPFSLADIKKDSHKLGPNIPSGDSASQQPMPEEAPRAVEPASKPKEPDAESANEKPAEPQEPEGESKPTEPEILVQEPTDFGFNGIWEQSECSLRKVMETAEETVLVEADVSLESLTDGEVRIDQGADPGKDQTLAVNYFGNPDFEYADHDSFTSKAKVIRLTGITSTHDLSLVFESMSEGVVGVVFDDEQMGRLSKFNHDALKAAAQIRNGAEGITLSDAQTLVLEMNANPYFGGDGDPLLASDFTERQVQMVLDIANGSYETIESSLESAPADTEHTINVSGVEGDTTSSVAENDQVPSGAETKEIEVESVEQTTPTDLSVFAEEVDGLSRDNFTKQGDNQWMYESPDHERKITVQLNDNIGTITFISVDPDTGEQEIVNMVNYGHSTNNGEPPRSLEDAITQIKEMAEESANQQSPITVTSEETTPAQSTNDVDSTSTQNEKSADSTVTVGETDEIIVKVASDANNRSEGQMTADQAAQKETRSSEVVVESPVESPPANNQELLTEISQELGLVNAESFTVAGDGSSQVVFGGGAIRVTTDEVVIIYQDKNYTFTPEMFREAGYGDLYDKVMGELNAQQESSQDSAPAVEGTVSIGDFRSQLEAIDNSIFNLDNYTHTNQVVNGIQAFSELPTNGFSEIENNLEFLNRIAVSSEEVVKQASGDRSVSPAKSIWLEMSDTGEIPNSMTVELECGESAITHIVNSDSIDGLVTDRVASQDDFNRWASEANKEIFDSFSLADLSTLAEEFDAIMIEIEAERANGATGSNLLEHLFTNVNGNSQFEETYSRLSEFSSGSNQEKARSIFEMGMNNDHKDEVWSDALKSQLGYDVASEAPRLFQLITSLSSSTTFK